MNHIKRSRRQFLKSLIDTSAKGLLLTALPLANTPFVSALQASSDTNQIPPIGMGTWITFNVGNSEKLIQQRSQVLQAFFENGGGVIDPPDRGAGLRRVWSDSQGKLWASGWYSGNLYKYDPLASQWQVWKLPGDNPSVYSVYVDETDKIWLSDFNANAVLRFDPEAKRFETFEIPRSAAAVRQMLGRKGEVWAAESSTDRLTVYRYGK